MNKCLCLILASFTLVLATVLNLIFWSGLKEEHRKSHDHLRFPRSLSHVPNWYQLLFDEPMIFDQKPRSSKDILGFSRISKGHFLDIPSDLEPLRVQSRLGYLQKGHAFSNNGDKGANETELDTKASAKEKHRIKVRMFGNDLIIPNGVKYLKDVPAFLTKLGEKTKEIRIQALNMQIRKLQTWKKKLLLSLGRNETDDDKAERAEPRLSSLDPSATDPSPTSFASNDQSFQHLEASTSLNEDSETENTVAVDISHLALSTAIYSSPIDHLPHRTWRKRTRKTRPKTNLSNENMESGTSTPLPVSNSDLEASTTEEYSISWLDDNPGPNNEKDKDGPDQVKGREENFEYIPHDSELYPERSRV